MKYWGEQTAKRNTQPRRVHTNGQAGWVVVKHQPCEHTETPADVRDTQASALLVFSSNSTCVNRTDMMLSKSQDVWHIRMSFLFVGGVARNRSVGRSVGGSVGGCGGCWWWFHACRACARNRTNERTNDEEKDGFSPQFTTYLSNRAATDDFYRYVSPVNAFHTQQHQNTNM